MMDYTDRHCRYFHRLLSPNARLYTEMVTAHALNFGHVERLLRFDSRERPVVLQIGGSDPALVASGAKAGAMAGYDEINLNVGCPSDRVQAGRFGACLMAEPDLVAQCVASIKERVDVPVTVKTRIGIDHQDSYEFLAEFTARLCGVIDALIVHARKAWLTGLSPKENRTVPPLDYDRVRRLKGDFPELPIIINGGVRSVPDALGLLESFDGVMVGRRAYHDPLMLPALDRAIFENSKAPVEPMPPLEDYLRYARARMIRGDTAISLLKPLQGLFAGQPGARKWRRRVGELSRPRSHGPHDICREVLLAAQGLNGSGSRPKSSSTLATKNISAA